MTRLGWIVVLVSGGVAGLIGAALVWKGGLPPLPAALIGWNVVTLLGYGYDKHEVRAGRWRVPEMALHLLGLLGGTPGALVGQRLFHHKTRDRKFQIIFWAMVAVQILIVALIMYLRK